MGLTPPHAATTTNKNLISHVSRAEHHTMASLAASVLTAAPVSSFSRAKVSSVSAKAPRRSAARSHCQVPCGIFDDKRQIAKLKEDAATIRKAQTELNDAGVAGTVAAANTFTRWVIYKEKHADDIISDVGYYFMAQRFPKWEFGDDAEYQSALVLHHKLMIAAVKAKQATDLATSDALDAAIEAVAALPMYA